MINCSQVAVDNKSIRYVWQISNSRTLDTMLHLITIQPRNIQSAVVLSDASVSRKQYQINIYTAFLSPPAIGGVGAVSGLGFPTSRWTESGAGLGLSLAGGTLTFVLL